MTQAKPSLIFFQMITGAFFHLQIVQKAGGSQEKTGKRRIRTKKQNRVERRGEHKERRLRRSESFTSTTRQGTRDGRFYHFLP